MRFTADMHYEIKRTMVKRLLQNHLIMSAFYKGISGISLFVSIPMLIQYLGDSAYGLWILVFTLFQWVLLLDFGLASVLKTKIPELKLEGKTSLINAYIRFTYAFTAKLAVFIFAMLIMLLSVLDVTTLFNIPFTSQFVWQIFAINIMFFCLNFILNTHKSLYVSVFRGKYAEQSLAVNQIFFLLSVGIALLFPFESIEDRLYLISFLSGSICLLVNVLYTVHLFRTENISLKTSETVPPDFLRNIYKLGLKYMIIQTGILFLFSSDSYILAYFYSPKDIVPYEVVSKYFQFPMLILMAGMAPLWSMFSQKYLEANRSWLLRSFRNFNLAFLGLLLGIAVFTLIAPQVMQLWVGEAIAIPQMLIVVTAIMTALRIFTLFYSYFFNGIGKLKSYLILLVVSVLLKLPLSYLFIKLNYGLSSVVIASALCLLLWSVVQPIDAYRTVKTL